MAQGVGICTWIQGLRPSWHKDTQRSWQKPHTIFWRPCSWGANWPRVKLPPTPTSPQTEVLEMVYRVRRLYLFIMAQSNEERSSGNVVSVQQELKGL